MSNVLLFRGKAGVGKTTLSNTVAKELKWAIIRKDDIYDPLAIRIKDHQERNEICERVIENFILTQIENQSHCIIDSSYYFKPHFLQFRDWVLEKGGNFISIVLNCSDEDLWAKRLIPRQENPKPNNLITGFNELKRYYGNMWTESLEGELNLDSKFNVFVLKKQSLEYIKNQI